MLYESLSRKILHSKTLQTLSFNVCSGLLKDLSPGIYFVLGLGSWDSLQNPAAFKRTCIASLQPFQNPSEPPLDEAL